MLIDIDTRKKKTDEWFPHHSQRQNLFQGHVEYNRQRKKNEKLRKSGPDHVTLPSVGTKMVTRSRMFSASAATMFFQPRVTFMTHLSCRVSVCKHKLRPLLKRWGSCLSTAEPRSREGKTEPQRNLKPEQSTVSYRHSDGDSNESVSLQKWNLKFHARDSAATVVLKIPGCSIFHARRFETASVWSRANGSGRKLPAGKRSGSCRVS